VKRRSGTCTWHVPVEIAPRIEPPRDPRKPKPKAKKSGPHKPTWRWHRRNPVMDESPPPPAVAVHITGAAGLSLLSAEHGTHRFTAGGSTAIVRVSFDPKARSRWSDQDPEELEKAQPDDEIRRIWPDKGIVEDLRLGRRFELAHRGIDLGQLLAAYQRWRLFSGDPP
jgi:hypothetical protein